MTSLHKSTDGTRARSTYRHSFVETLPDRLDEGVLYVCMQYATSAHNCFCGCGREVVTPIHPTKWQLSFDGIDVSLTPSIGSWALPCKSHYWLQNGRVAWAETWADDDIEAAQSRDVAAQDSYFAERRGASQDEQPQGAKAEPTKQPSMWREMAKWLWGE